MILFTEEVDEEDDLVIYCVLCGHCYVNKCKYGSL